MAEPKPFLEKNQILEYRLRPEDLEKLSLVNELRQKPELMTWVSRWVRDKVVTKTDLQTLMYLILYLGKEKLNSKSRQRALELIYADKGMLPVLAQFLEENRDKESLLFEQYLFEAQPGDGPEEFKKMVATIADALLERKITEVDTGLVPTIAYAFSLLKKHIDDPKVSVQMFFNVSAGTQLRVRPRSKDHDILVLRVDTFNLVDYLDLEEMKVYKVHRETLHGMILGEVFGRVAESLQWVRYAAKAMIDFIGFVIPPSRHVINGSKVLTIANYIAVHWEDLKQIAEVIAENAAWLWKNAKGWIIFALGTALPIIVADKISEEVELIFKLNPEKTLKFLAKRLRKMLHPKLKYLGSGSRIDDIISAMEAEDLKASRSIWQKIKGSIIAVFKFLLSVIKKLLFVLILLSKNISGKVTEEGMISKAGKKFEEEFGLKPAEAADLAKKLFNTFNIDTLVGKDGEGERNEILSRIEVILNALSSFVGHIRQIKNKALL